MGVSKRLWSTLRCSGWHSWKLHGDLGLNALPQHTTQSSGGPSSLNGLSLMLSEVVFYLIAHQEQQILDFLCVCTKKCELLTLLAVQHLERITHTMAPKTHSSRDWEDRSWGTEIQTKMASKGDVQKGRGSGGGSGVLNRQVQVCVCTPQEGTR